MLSFLSVIDFLGFKAENTALFIVLLLFYMIFKHKFELLSKEIKHVKEDLSKDIGHIKEDLSKDIDHIKENLGNHVTDTNKKIDHLALKIDQFFKK